MVLRRKVLQYNPELKKVARMLRNRSTRSEILLWDQLKGKQMLGYDFHRQKPVGRYIIDFFCPRLMLTIELDGSSHEDREREDRRRQEDLEQQGIQFLRFPDNEVKQNLEGVVEEIRGWISEHKKK